MNFIVDPFHASPHVGEFCSPAHAPYKAPGTFIMFWACGLGARHTVVAFVCLFLQLGDVRHSQPGALARSQVVRRQDSRQGLSEVICGLGKRSVCAALCRSPDYAANQISVTQAHAQTTNSAQPPALGHAPSANERRQTSLLS